MGGAAPARAGEAPAAGRMVERSFTNQAGTRRYLLYVPKGGSTGRPLMVWLHGCGRPGTMEAGHALARVAEERGFTLAYPLQDRAANAENCWNWLGPTDRHRGSGEASIIAGITTTLQRELDIDPARVYVGGYSAGGAMTTVMGAAYPDLYAAIAPASGAPYALDASGASAAAEMGARARPVPVFLLQGVADEISVYPIGRSNLLQWLGTDDRADDGRANGSVSLVPATTVPQLPGPDSPLPLVVESYRAGDGCLLGQFLTSPAEHLVDALLLYEDTGLGLQRQMMDFLLAHRRGGPRQACG
ncbi:MAG TPA: PHB depolymerase family esterase [Acidimicrobiia bacterium]|nr:PHB depolymerase family esterase [Acidimicrobiia bacterium]